MEKQLELKEASTRRKIIALKQQLIGNQNPVHKPMAVPTNTSTKAHFQSTNPLSQPDVRHPPFTAPPPDVSQAMRDEDVTKSTSDRLATSVNGRLEFMQQHNYNHTYTYRGFSNRTDPVTPKLPTSTSINRLTPKSSPHLQPSSNIAPYEPHLANVGESKQSNKDHDFKPAQYNRTPYGSVSPHMQRVDSSSLTVPKDGANKTPPITLSKTASSQQPPKPTVSKTTPVKLTLPEAIKETEYMTALQRQKARVSRIRRCIIAATVIQRTWRNHKERLK